MELFSVEWLSALVAIVLIDLVLAGDNAIVIAMAARDLPQELRKRAIVWGTVGAIALRTLMTAGAVRLLQIPGLMLVGGIGLTWIAFRLLSPRRQRAGHARSAATFWGAIRTIVVADALMGVDNVLGVAGAAKGSIDLVVIGLTLSVPIVVLGSTLVLGLIERLPAIKYVAAAVIAYAAAHMIVSESLLDDVFDPSLLNRLTLHVLVIAGVIVAGRWSARRVADRAPPQA